MECDVCRASEYRGRIRTHVERATVPLDQIELTFRRWFRVLSSVVVFRRVEMVMSSFIDRIVEAGISSIDSISHDDEIDDGDKG